MSSKRVLCLLVSIRRDCSMKVLCFCAFLPIALTERQTRSHSSDTLSTDAWDAFSVSSFIGLDEEDVPVSVVEPVNEGSLARIYQWWKAIHFRHSCNNCKALVDYEWILTEYGKTWIVKALMILLIVVLIWLLGTTAADFFVPPLLYVSERLRIPQELAGATILALGNGAPDVFAVATAATKGDLPLSVSEMLGSNMFTLCITGGFCLFFWSRCRPEENEDISAAEAMLQAKLGEAPGADKEVGQPGVNIYQAEYMREKARMFEKRMLYTLAIYVLSLSMVAMVLMYGTHSVWKAAFLPPIYLAYLGMLWSFSEARSEPTSEHAGATICDAEPDRHFEPLAGLSKPKNATILGTTAWVVKLPAYIIRWMCIPPVDGQWSAQHRVISSFSPTGLLLFCWLTDTGNMQDLNLFPMLGLILLAVTMSVTMFLCSSSTPTLPWFYPVLPFIALVSGVLWLAVLAAEITAVLEAIGYAMQVPRLRLGFTAIAWGNSVGDLLVCIYTVRKGHASMAIAAIFAGPLVDDLIALGSAFIMIALREGHTPVMCGQDCPKELRGPLVVSLGYVAVAVTMLASMLRCRGQLKSLVWACSLVALYISFLFVILFVLHVDAPPAKEVK